MPTQRLTTDLATRLPPPAPPTPPPNPWSGRTRIPSKPLINWSVWPHRLLHVKTMTSYARQGQSTYNGVNAPLYNVLSYTWGRFMDRTMQETPLLVHGISWPVPSIQKTHFSAAAFRDAIHCAANGYRNTCEWLWVDIACIPQEHDKETPEAAHIRDQEISRQVEIFHRAKEAFAWLSSFRKLDLIQDRGKLISIDDFILYFNEHQNEVRTMETATRFLDSLEEYSRLVTEPITTMLNHQWFNSLWTLQEMILRPDAFILFDDGLLEVGDTDDGPLRPWNLNTLKLDVYALRTTLTGRHVVRALGDAELIADRILSDGTSTSISLSKDKSRSARIVQRLEKFRILQQLKGLDALDIKFPHTAYSLAQQRHTSKPEDLIHGIVQTYGITCGPLPAGGDPISRLHALEDEFGEKLVTKSPVLSQLFIHSGEGNPRRSWLITQECKVDDHFWAQFTEDHRQVNTLYLSLEVVKKPDYGRPQEYYLQFVGNAWCLDTFVQCPNSVTLRTFVPFNPGVPDRYRGLMLDNHVSKSALLSIIDYFPDREIMLNSVKRLYQYYPIVNGYSERDSIRQHEISAMIKVAPLASVSPYNLPVVDYVGIVLAPSPTNNGCCNATDQGNTPAPCIATWRRIGLIRWTETYDDENPVLHRQLPPYHEFNGLIK